MKKFVCLLLSLVCMCSIFTACSESMSDVSDSDSNKDKESIISTSGTTTATPQETHKINELPATEAPDFLPEDEVATEDTADESEDKRDAKWTYNTDDKGYSNAYHSSGDFSGDVIMNSDGDIVYKTSEGEEIELYGNGYFISKQNGVQYLKKADGTEVCSTKSLNVTGFGLTENYDYYHKFLADGYIFVYNIINTYSSSTFEIGILGTDGNWIVPLSEKNPIISSGANYDEKILKQHSYIYVDDGILALPVYDAAGDYKLYDIKTNKVHEFVGEIPYDLDYWVECKISFKDGVDYIDDNNYIYKICSDGKISRTDVGSECYDFYVDKNENYYTITDKRIRLNGKVKVEFDYTVSSAVNIGDKWLVIIKNPNGAKYYTYLTLDGEFLFEPIATEAVYICDLSGVGVGSNFVDGVKVVIDSEGNVIYTCSWESSEIYVKKDVVGEEYLSGLSTKMKYEFLNIP